MNKITISLLIIFILSTCNPTLATPEPDWNKINYGVPEQEEVYGEPFIANYSDIGYGGADEVHTLTKEQFKESWDHIIKWKNNNGGVWPKYVDISKYHVCVDKINEKTYKKMHDRWEKYKNEHNGQEPNTIKIEDKTDNSGNNKPSNLGTIQKKLINAIGTFNTFTEFYNQCKGRQSSFYKNHKYSRDTSIQRLKNRQGLNCVDASLLGYALAKEMGYDVKFQETYCPKDNVGHVLLKVKGKELGSNWVIVDLAACISVNSKASLGHHWCSPPHDSNYNWAKHAELK